MPNRKIGAAGLGGAIGTITVWGVGAIWGVDVPPEVGAAWATVLAFGLGYLVPEKVSEENA